MARWPEPLVALALLVGAAGQAAPPGEFFAAGDVRRAVLMELADFYEQPSSDGSVVRTLAAGTVLEYVGETTDAFGRTWSAVRDPDRVVRRRDTYLVPYDRRQFAAYGFRGALLADRRFAPAAAPAAAAAPGPEEEKPWWQPVGVLELGNNATFDEVVAISARAPSEEEVQQLIGLLGGVDAIADWPADPLPGQLFVPVMVPVLFRFDGADWQIAQPVRLLGESLNLLGNGALRPDTRVPPPAGGPALHCWELVGAVDPRNELAGSVAVAEPPAPTAGEPVANVGAYDASLAPQVILDLLSPPPPGARVPTRVDPPVAAAGIVLSDNDGRQAVFIQQRLGPELTHAVRGKSLVLDVVARDAPRAQAAATFGIDIEAGFADDRRPLHFSTSYTSGPTSRRFEWAFEVPIDAETLTVRVLPLDLTLAVDQRGEVVFERVALRLATWEPLPPAASVVLYRISAGAFEGSVLYTRAAVAISTRTDDEIRAAWPQVARSTWNEEDKALVLAGELREGMTPEQVRAAWGEPADASTPVAGLPGETRWDYGDRWAVFADGQLILFRPRQLNESEPPPRICPGGPPAPGPEMRP